MKQWIYNLLIACLGILAPIKPLLLAVIFIVLADAVFGVWAAVKRGEKVTSAGMRRTITKLLVFLLAVICGFIVEIVMINEFLPISKIIASAIGLVELKSILENCNYILGYDLFKTVIQKLGSKNDENS